MFHNRLTGYFSERSRIARRAQESLDGFTENPLHESVTAEQSRVYEEAYRQAVKDLEESKWLTAEIWN